MDQQEIILNIEGGFCSQLNFAALGKLLEDKGYSVFYDLTFFDENPSFLFVIPKALPNFPMKIADKNKIAEFTKFLENKSWFQKPGYKLFPETESEKDMFKKNFPQTFKLGCNIPKYLLGFPAGRFQALVQYKDFFAEMLTPFLNEKNQNYCSEIQNTKSCAVHVRRGDLSSTYASGYGYPVHPDFFVHAINLIQKLDKIKFFFFSEDIEWVKTNILSKLSNEINYTCCVENSYNEGYIDFYLMTQCDYIIGSQGTFAIFAKLLSKKSPLLVTPRYHEGILWNCPNIIFMNDNYYLHKEEEKQRIIEEKQQVIEEEQQLINKKKQIIKRKTSFINEKHQINFSALKYRIYIYIFNYIKNKLSSKNMI